MSTEGSPKTLSDVSPFQDNVNQSPPPSPQSSQWGDVAKMENDLNQIQRIILQVSEHMKTTTQTRRHGLELAVELEQALPLIASLRSSLSKEEATRQQLNMVTVNTNNLKAVINEVIASAVEEAITPINIQLTELQDSIKEAKEDSLGNPTLPQQFRVTPTYAEKVSSGKVPPFKVPTFVEKADPALVFASSTRGMSSSKIRDIVKEAATSSGTQVRPCDLVFSRYQRFITKFKTREEAEAFQRDIEQHLPKEVTAMIPKTKWKSIVLINTPEGITRDELSEKLMGMLPQPPVHMDFTYTTSPKNGQVNHIIDLDTISYATLITTGKLLLHFSSIQIRPNFNFMRCRLCQMYGHTSKNCFRSPVCGNCAQPHRDAECPSNDHVCINCYSNKLEHYDHQAFSPQCDIFRQKKEEFLKQEYEFAAALIYKGYAALY